MNECHMIEMVEGKASIAWAGEKPWHGLGTEVPHDLAPAQILKAAGLDWEVNATPCFAEIGGKLVEVDRSALIRSTDNKVLDIISSDWKPYQNADAFDFFNDFVASGDMNMEVAGSLRGGQIVWALARVNESFEVCGGKDKVDMFLNFTNPHRYGQSIDVRMTPIRVVCNNTITMALNQKSKNFVKVNHRRDFDPDMVKEALGIAKFKLATYKDQAEFLTQRRYKDEDIVEYFNRIFPLTSNVREKEASRNAEIAKSLMDIQPGAEMGEGTFWQLYNTVTFMTNHVVGRSADTRLASNWYGAGSRTNQNALEVALEMAS